MINRTYKSIQFSSDSNILIDTYNINGDEETIIINEIRMVIFIFTFYQCITYISYIYIFV